MYTLHDQFLDFEFTLSLLHDIIGITISKALLFALCHYATFGHLKFSPEATWQCVQC